MWYDFWQVFGPYGTGLQPLFKGLAISCLIGVPALMILIIFVRYTA